MRRRRLSVLTVAGLSALATAVPLISPAGAADAPDKQATAIGRGGAVATVDADATQVGLEVLRRGGNAADAAVAAAAALGVTEPYSTGIGGGGFFVYFDAATGEVSTIDGRETAPRAMGAGAFLDDEGEALPFNTAVQSGLSVGTPGTPRTWERVLEEHGTMSLAEVLAGAVRLAEEGFVVDQTFRNQTAMNETKFRTFAETTQVFLPSGQLPEVGSVFRNPDLAQTYRLLAREGVDAFYSGPLAEDIVETARDPQESPGTPEVLGGLLALRDLTDYEVLLRQPTRSDYRGLEVFGMPPPSSGGSTVAEALNILERFPLGELSETQVLHHYLEAGALAFADRNLYIGDPAYVQVPLAELLSDGFAAERACEIRPDRALVKPVPAGVPDGEYALCPAVGTATRAENPEGLSTTHLTVADARGNVASYTSTIEATGGSGITVPDRGFLLNNELTDFTFTAPLGVAEPNLPAPGKRPRSSMAPTIVLEDGEPLLALGSPGGSTIITTVLQTLVNRIDRDFGLGAAIAAPRAATRNTPLLLAEAEFLRLHEAELAALGHQFVSTDEIGAATGIEFLSDGLLLAAAEPTRRGGGSAGVVLEPGALAALRARLLAYNVDGTISDRTTASLLDRLDRADAAAQAGSEARTIALLEQFVARVRSQVRGDERDVTARDALVADATTVLASYRVVDDAEEAPRP